MGGIAFGLFLFLLPALVASHRVHSEWMVSAAGYSRFFGALFVLLGLLLLLRGRGEMRRLAIAGLIGTLGLNTLFTLTMWSRFDLNPTARLVRAAADAHHALAMEGSYDGEFQFASRLRQPVAELRGKPALLAFAKAHPDGLIISHPSRLDATALRYALLVQPFRSTWIVVWPAATLADLRSGITPPSLSRGAVTGCDRRSGTPPRCA